MSTTTTTTDKATMTPLRPLYPLGVPGKFSPEGVVQRYPGNTTVCHLAADSPLLPVMRAIYSAISSHPIFSKNMHLLPPPSWHMTVLDGVREKECEPGMWPPGKEKKPLAECTEEFSKNLKQLGLKLEEEGLAPPYRMRVRGFGDCTVGLGFEAEGATAEEEKRMRRLRDRLADTVGFRAPNHERYGFHVTISYLLRHLEESEREELNKMLAEYLPILQRDIFELGAVEFCTFENMHEFPRLFYLGDREGKK